MKIHPFVHCTGRLARLGLCLLLARSAIASDCLAAPEAAHERAANAQQNHCPEANAGIDLTVTAGQPVTLDASGSSDLDGDRLAYRWRILRTPLGSAAFIGNAAAARTQLTPDLAGTYELELSIKDARGAVSVDRLTLSTHDSPPVARAGEDRTATVGEPVALDAIGSFDLDGAELHYTWRLAEVPAGSTARLDVTQRAEVWFTPDVHGVYVAELNVSDGHRQSATDRVRISTRNTRPVASAGRARTLAPGSTLLLDGTRSLDVDGDALGFEWRILSAPDGARVQLDGATQATASAYLETEGQYVFQLVASDGELLSEPATVLAEVVERRTAVVDRAAARSQFAGRGGFDDEDGDGVTDIDDNCVLAPNPDQRDTDGDGIGNACDPDLNNDGVVNVIDLGILRAVFFTNDPDADFNGDGIVNVVDLGVMRSRFFQPPGPAGLIIWVSLVDGDFANRLNWEPQIVPAQGSAALIDVEPAVTVTSTSDNILVGNIVNNESLVFSGSTLEASKGIDSSGPITMTNTAVNRTEFRPTDAGAGSIDFSGFSTWDTVTLALDAAINNGSTISVVNRMTVNSSLTIVAPSSPTGLVTTAGTTLDGNGSITFDSASNTVVSEPRIAPQNGTLLTIGPDLVINGTRGTVGNASAALVFEGTLDSAIGGEPLVLAASNLAGNGTLIARNGGQIDLDADFNNPGDTLTLDGADGLIQLLSTTAVRNATLDMTANTTVQIPAAASVTLQGATINGNLTQFNGSSIAVLDALTLNGTSTIVAPSSPTGYVFQNSLTVDGNAEFAIDGSGNSVQSEPRLFQNNGTTLTLAPTVLISGGNGTVGNASANLVFQGDLLANVDGEQLAIGSGTWSATGTLAASNNGSVRLFGNLSNGGLPVGLDTAAGSLLWTNGAQINNAVVNGTVGTTLIVPSGAYTWSANTLNIDVSLQDAANINVSSGLVNNGTILITAPSSQTGLTFVDTQIVAGTGTIRLDGTGNSVQGETRLFPVNGTVLTVGAGIDIRGGNGVIGNGSAGLALLGTLNADVDGQELAIGGNSWSANNAMSASNGGGLRFFGSMNNANGALAIDTADGFFNWTNGGQINAAVLTGTAGSALRVPGGSYTATGSTFNLDMTLENGANVNVVDGMTYNGAMQIDAPSSPTGLFFVNTQTLDGAGTITLNGVGNTVISEPRLLQSNGTTLTIGAGITINGGKGTVGNGSAVLNFDGTLRANVAGEELRIGGSTWRASQTIEASDGGTVALFGNHDNAGGSFTLNSTADTASLLNGAALRNTTINGTPGTNLALLGSTQLDNAVLSLDLQLDNGANATVTNGLSINGTAAINSTSSPTGLVFGNTQSLLGNLTVVIDGTANSVISEPRLLPLNGTTLTLGPNVRIEGGQGTIGNPSAALVLDGAVVDANVAGEALRLSGNLIRASNTIGASDGGILQLNGNLDNAGAAFTLAADTGSVQTVGGMNLRNATINATPGTVTTLLGAGTFENLVYTGDLVITNGVNVTVPTDLTLNGTVTIDAPSSPTGLTFTANAVLGGDVDIVFQGNVVLAEARVFPVNGTVLTIGPQVTLRGGLGTLGQPSADVSLQGQLIADAGNLRASSATALGGAALGADGGHTLEFDGVASPTLTYHIGAGSTVVMTAGATMDASTVTNVAIDGTGSGLLQAPSIVHDGTLNISAVNGFAPAVGDAFAITGESVGFAGTGAFATVNSSGLGAGESFSLSYSGSGRAIATVTN